MQFVRAGDITTHYAAAGAGDAPVVVFAHALGTDLRIWDDVVASVSRDYRCLRYDQRGHGLTDLGAAPITIPLLATDLLRLLDALHVERAVICGMSIGGLIAQQAYHLAPARCAGLVLCDTGPSIGSPELWNDRIAAIGRDGIAALADGILARWFGPAFRGNRRAAYDGFRNMLTRTAVEGYIGACAAIRDADLTALTRSLAVPTLVICGAGDAATPPDRVAAFAAAIPGARYEVIDGAGHLPCVERADVFARLLLSFLPEVHHG
jgi:3-oxoadipate enol-lactonase